MDADTTIQQFAEMTTAAVGAIHTTTTGHSGILRRQVEVLQTLVNRQNALVELLDEAGIVTRDDLENRVLRNLARAEQQQAEERDFGIDPNTTDTPDA